MRHFDGQKVCRRSLSERIQHRITPSKKKHSVTVRNLINVCLERVSLYHTTTDVLLNNNFTLKLWHQNTFKQTHLESGMLAFSFYFAGTGCFDAEPAQLARHTDRVARHHRRPWSHCVLNCAVVSAGGRPSS
jgi:hypothetical protein